MAPWLPDVPAPPHDPLHLLLDPKTWADEPTDLKLALAKSVGVTAAAFTGSGAVRLSPTLDSQLAGCVWHRVVLTATVPRGTRVVVWAATAETPDDANPAWVELPPATAADADGTWDALLRCAPGRYLWLRLVLAGVGPVAPAVTRVRVEFPRLGLLRHLPAVFAENPTAADFTDRMLAVLDTTFRSVEARLDGFGRYLDPAAAPPDALRWLAGFVGLSLDRNWDDARRRRWLAAAWLLHRERGTPAGLRRLLLLFFGWTDPADARAPILVLEHFRLRRWLALGRGRLGDTAVLWGRDLLERDRVGTARLGVAAPEGCTDDDPAAFDAHRFTVFVPAAALRDPARRAAVGRLVALHKPAHTAHRVEPVEPRFRVGVQGCVGFDTVVGAYPTAARLPFAALGADSLLAASAPRVGTAVRVGVSTALASRPESPP